MAGSLSYGVYDAEIGKSDRIHNYCCTSKLVKLQIMMLYVQDRKTVAELELDWQPQGTDQLEAPLVNRRILLRTSKDIPILYASSWW